MIRHLPGLFYAPTATWKRLLEDSQQHPSGFIALLLLGSLIPAICVFYGGAIAGWEMFGSEKREFLSQHSAILLAAAVWLAYVSNAIIMGFMVRWVLFRQPNRPSVMRGMAFATLLSVPFMLGALVALYPARWLIVLAIPLVVGYSAAQLYVGLPIYMRLERDKANFYGVCILALGILTMLCVGLFYMESWREVSPYGSYQGVEEQQAEEQDFEINL